MLQESRGEQVPGTKMAWRFSEGGMTDWALKDWKGEVQERAKNRGRNDLAQGWAKYSLWIITGPPPVFVQATSQEQFHFKKLKIYIYIYIYIFHDM